MHAVVINGSPQEHGSTRVMLEHVLEPLEKSGWTTEMVQLGGRALRVCDGCTRCFKSATGLCAVESDDFNDIYLRMLPANAVILGSPAGFNAGLIPEVDNFINRSAYLATANRAALAGKVGTAVIDVPRGSFIEAHDKAHRFFLRSKMVVPGVSGWNTDSKRLHKHRKVSDKETLEEMRKLGEMVDWLARAVEPCLGSLPGEKGGLVAAAGSASGDSDVLNIYSRPEQALTKAVARRESNLPMIPPDNYSGLPDR